MKLCRYGPAGAERPGMVRADGRIGDLSAIVPDITAGAVPALADLSPESLPIVAGEPRLGAPVAGVGKIVAAGLNFADHAREANLPVPEEPVLFMKAVTSLSGPFDNVVLPRDSTHSDWEVELGLVIGRRCRYVDAASAMDCIAGYLIANDVSERFDQKYRGSQWSKGKGHDSFCPVGPWLVTPDEIADPHALDMYLDVNGQRMQTGNTRSMIFPLAELIAYASRFVTLLPGDILITGTPPGVGEGRKPQPIYLKPGDVMELGIAGLGVQRQSVVAWRDDSAVA